MSCYEPLMVAYKTETYDQVFDDLERLVDFKIRRKLNKNGNPEVRILGKFSGRESDYELIKSKNVFTIPCGKCIGCRLDYSRHWADRMMLEYEACKKAVFVTLTYENDNLSYGVDFETGEAIPELRKNHLSEFIKCLRSKFSDNGRPDIQVRFFGCGEYGEQRHRPHYHIILFGVDLIDLQTVVFSGDICSDLEPWTRNELGQVSYRSNLLEDVWKERGIVTVSDVSYETMAYVGRYSLKKAKGDFYAAEHGLIPEFTLMSRRPGIGAPFLDLQKEKNPKLLDEVNTWYIHGKEIYWPRYLLDKFYTNEYYGDGAESRFEEVKAQRQQVALDNFLNTYEMDDRPYFQKQDFLSRQKSFSVDKLKRGDVDFGELNKIKNL